MAFHHVRFLLALGPVVAQDLFLKAKEEAEAPRRLDVHVSVSVNVGGGGGGWTPDQRTPPTFAPAPPAPYPEAVYMPNCSLAAPGWPTFNTEDDLKADADWSQHFQAVYGEIPSFGYPICVGAFNQLPMSGGLDTKYSVQQCNNEELGSGSDGVLVDVMSPCCDPSGVVFIYNQRNTRHAVPENTWFEAQHNNRGGDRGAAWYYQVFGSAVWVYTGKTKVFKDHPEASQYFLSATCHDNRRHTSKPATECETDFADWYDKASEQSIQTVQFTEHFDCGCGEMGWSSWDQYNKLCQTEVFDVTGDGTWGCANGFRAGWAAQQNCDCDNDQEHANCKGFGI